MASFEEVRFPEDELSDFFDDETRNYRNDGECAECGIELSSDSVEASLKLCSEVLCYRCYHAQKKDQEFFNPNNPFWR